MSSPPTFTTLRPSISRYGIADAKEVSHLNQSARARTIEDNYSYSSKILAEQCLEFYGLREKPFSILPDPAYLYISGKRRMELAKLRMGVFNRAGVALITGEVGSGKTTLIHHLMQNADDDAVIGLIDNVHPRLENLLQWVLQAFHIEVTTDREVQLHRLFVDFIEEQAAKKRSVILFIDEAHNMSDQLLEELRLLMNVNVSRASFHTVLVGQVEILEVLKRTNMRQFTQRISIEHHLEPLNVLETYKYIHHRMQVAGREPELFTTEACRLIHDRSRGIPRLVNLLCEMTLEFGFDERKTIIDDVLVQDIVRNRTHAFLLSFGSETAEAPMRVSTSAPPSETKSPAPSNTTFTTGVQAVTGQRAPPAYPDTCSVWEAYEAYEACEAGRLNGKSHNEISHQVDDEITVKREDRKVYNKAADQLEDILERLSRALD